MTVGSAGAAPIEDRGARPTATRAAPTALGPLLVYVASAAWVLRGAWGASGGAGLRAVGAGIDLPGSLWFHGFVADCVATLRFPDRTSAFFAPDGKDIFADTGANVLDALVAVPFLAVFGAPAHMVPFVALLLVGNAVAMHVLLRALGLGTAAVVAGSVAYAFGPSVLHELDGGRPTQAMLWFWPLALRELVRMREDPRWRRPILAGLYVALQAWTYWFMGHFFAVVFAPALLVWGLAAGTSQARRDRAERLVIAGAVALVAVAPAVVPMVLRMARGEVPAGGALTHLAGAMGGRALDPDAWWILAPWASSLRIPTWWIGLLGVGLLGCRRRALWGVAALLGLLLVAGSRLAVATGSVPNPVWSLAALLPGFDRLLFAARAWPALGLVGAAALAEAIDRLGALASGHTRAAASPAPSIRGSDGAWPSVLAAVGVVVAVHAAHPAPVLATDASAPAYVAAVARAPGTVLDLPYPCAQLVIHLQPLHGQPLFGGMGEHIRALRPAGVDARIAASPLLQGLIAAATGGRSGPLTRDPATSSTRPRWIVLHEDVYVNPLAVTCIRREQTGPSAAESARRKLEALLGAPTVSDERATAWDLEGR